MNIITPNAVPLLIHLMHLAFVSRFCRFCVDDDCLSCYVGSVLMVVAQTEESGLNAGWTALPDGTMFTKVTEFRQTDINQGYIFYQHQSEDTDISTDTFTFQVCVTNLHRPFHILFACFPHLLTILFCKMTQTRDLLSGR